MATLMSDQPQQSSDQPQRERTETRRRPGFVGPAILVGLGVLLLLNNLGLLGWGVWSTLWRLWPVLLIALGLDILVGRRSMAGSLLIAVLLLVVLGAAVWWSNVWPIAGTPLTSTTINQPLAGATSGRVELGLGVGELRLRAMDEPGALIAGTVENRSDERISQQFHVANGVATYILRFENATPQPFTSHNENELWNLQLNPAVPIDLRLDTGVGTTNADLSGLRITDLSVNSGVGTTNLTLPARSTLRGEINGGVGTTNLTLPSGVAARIRVAKGLGDVRVPDGFTRQGDLYTSPGYDQAANRVDLRINGGIGNITIRSSQ